MGSVRCSTVYPEKFSGTGPIWGADSCDDDMCQIDDKDDFIVHQSVKFSSAILSDDINKVTNCFHYSSCPSGILIYKFSN